MNPWQWIVIFGLVLSFVAIAGERKAFFVIANISRKIISIAFVLGGLFFAGLGSIYIFSDIKAIITILTTNVSYPEGPGLALVMGFSFICASIILFFIGAVVFKYKPKKREN